MSALPSLFGMALVLTVVFYVCCFLRSKETFYEDQPLRRYLPLFAKDEERVGCYYELLPGETACVPNKAVAVLRDAVRVIPICEHRVDGQSLATVEGVDVILSQRLATSRTVTQMLRSVFRWDDHCSLRHRGDCGLMKIIISRPFRFFFVHENCIF